MNAELAFDTKIAVVLCEDLASWQTLNVTAFLSSGLIGANPGLIGEAYEDADGNTYNALAVQPIIVLSASRALLKTIHQRALRRGVQLSLYTEEMFSTGHDVANRAVVKNCPSANLNIVGLALREDKKTVDKVTKGAKMHP